jgi:hypothetical protein
MGLPRECVPSLGRPRSFWSGWDGVVTAAVTLVGPIAYFTRASQKNSLDSSRLTSNPAFLKGTLVHGLRPTLSCFLFQILRWLFSQLDLPNQDLGNSFTSVSIPERGHASLLCLPAQHSR